VKRYELTIRNQQPVRRTLFHDQSGITIVGPNPEEVTIAYTCSTFYEFISDFVSETEGIINIRLGLWLHQGLK
jgi:hypothetical protein